MLELVKMDLVKQELESYKHSVEAVLSFTKNLEVNSKGDAKGAIDYIAKARKLLQDIEARKKDITRDARDYIGKVNNLAKDFIEPLCLVEDMILQKIDHWKISSGIEREAEAERVSQMEEFGIEILPLFDDDTKVRSDLATAYEKITYSFALQDKNLVPLEYLSVDEEKVNVAIKNGIRSIPGLTIEKKTKTVIRRK